MKAVLALSVSSVLACGRAEPPKAAPAQSAPVRMMPSPSNLTLTNDGAPLVDVSAEEQKTEVVAAYGAMYEAMLAARTDRLGALLDETYSLTHMTGYRQPKAEWLRAIDAGQMRYHSATEKAVSTRVTGDTAVLVGKSVVDATIYGSRGIWNLQLTSDYARKDGKWIAMRTVASTF